MKLYSLNKDFHLPEINELKTLLKNHGVKCSIKMSEFKDIFELDVLGIPVNYITEANGRIVQVNRWITIPNPILFNWMPVYPISIEVYKNIS